LLTIARRFPEQVWIKRVINSAIEIAMRNLWTALAPGDFLKLTQNANRYLVQNATHLQELIIESLERLQQKLQGENPAAEDLWNANEPKDENYLSDYISRHLRNDLDGRGLVASREVEIARGDGHGTGERTDLYVTYPVFCRHDDRVETIRVIIEVKCTWHPKWKTAMKTQLVYRYLADNDCRHGIYLVGWYTGSRWNKQTNTFKKSSKDSYADVNNLLVLQAEFESINSSGIRVRSFVLDNHLT